MERIFIDREWCIAYVVLALDSIYNSANKERTLNDFIEEIKTMFNVHQDETILLKIAYERKIIKNLLQTFFLHFK